MDPVPATLDAAIKKLDEMTRGSDGKGKYGPTGFGDDWVRIGPLKVLLDGGVLIGTAYMREPWGCGDTYQITDPNYRGGAAKCRNLSGLRTTYSARITPPSISNAAV